MSQLVQTSISSSHPRIVAAVRKVPALLTPGEAPVCIVVQLPYAAYIGWSRRSIVVATNHRLIIISRGIFGGFSMRDVQWQDLLDAHVTERSMTGVFGCEFVANTKRGRYVVYGLPSTEAFGLYRVCQEREQEWREKNRIRDMEEARARAGGVMMGPGSRSTFAAPNAVGGEIMQQLQQLQQLRQSGILSDVEMESMKAKLFAGI